ncbi:MAG: C-terminal binding protein [Alkalispirochaeta sp.]
MIRCRTTDYVEPDMEWEQTRYAEAGIDYRALQLRFASEEEVIANVADAHVIITDQVVISKGVIDAAPELKLVIRHGEGYDNVDLPAATARGVAVANKPAFWSEEVADHALTLILAGRSKLGIQQQIARREGLGATQNWRVADAFPIPRINGLTLGIVGFGKIGRFLADKARALGMKILVHDPFLTDLDPAVGDAVPLDELFKRADAISLHVPATPDTEGLLDATAFRKMKATATVVNCSRGAVIVTDDLVDALRRGTIAAACLDATSPEPLPQDHPLLSLPQAIVTPHLGWYSDEALWNMRRSIVDDVLALAEGRYPESVVNPEVLSR